MGAALPFPCQRYTIRVELVDELRAVTFYDKPKDDEALSELLIATLDARNYVILGDPAVRLPLAQDRRPSSGRPSRPRSGSR